jgi:hypothetical protein
MKTTALNSHGRRVSDVHAEWRSWKKKESNFNENLKSLAEFIGVQLE